jgi:hypothetical protein
MEERIYFWSHFEEPATIETITQDTYGKTLTRQREEPDQRLTGMIAGTTTLTATREEPDQDPHHLGYGVIPRSAASTSTKTFTKTREEPDQDVHLEYGAIPRQATSTSTKTLTEAREEPDQDLSCESYGSFKPNG